MTTDFSGDATPSHAVAVATLPAVSAPAIPTPSSLPQSPSAARGVPTALPTALLIDMDDTILADSEGRAEAWRMTCERYIARIAPVSVERLLLAFHTYSDWYWSDPERHREGRLDMTAARTIILMEALRRVGAYARTRNTKKAEAQREALAREMALTYQHMRDERSRPGPGAIEALQKLHAHGVRLALITNGGAAMQRRKIEYHKLAQFFETIIIEGEFGVGKPDPAVYLHALKTLDLAPADVWMVGDNLKWEVAAPQQLGITGVWLDVRGTGLPADAPAQPDYIIRSLAELAALT